MCLKKYAMEQEMEAFYSLGADEKEKRYMGLAANALELFGVPVDSRLTLLGRRENAVFRVDSPEGKENYVIRVHRYGYQSAESVDSEIKWMAALRETGIRTPEFVAGLNGESVQLVGANDVPEPHICDLLRWEDGVPPVEANIVESYRMLGEINAQIHNQALTWSKPEGFCRQSWCEDGMLGENPVWGRFWYLDELDEPQRNLLLKARDVAHGRLKEFGKGSDRFGLIHADLMPDNILVANGSPLVIDFDDCGFGWNLYDLATSLWMHEGEDYYDQIIAAWVEGYRSVRDLPESHLEELPTFLMTRSLVALGWLYTRRETEVAKEYTLPIIGKACHQAAEYLKAQ